MAAAFATDHSGVQGLNQPGPIEFKNLSGILHLLIKTSAWRSPSVGVMNTTTKDALMSSPAMARAMAVAAVVLCLVIAAVAALLGLRRLDGEWDWLAVVSVTGLALFAVGVIRLILGSVDNLIERLGRNGEDPP